MDKGAIKTSPKQATLLYVGTDSSPAEWKDFEFTTTIKTGDGANSGVWFHTPPDGSGVTEKQTRGFEVQVARSNGNSRMTGTLYFFTQGTPVTHQGEWFKLRSTVKGDKFTCYVDGKKVNEWTQPRGWTPPNNAPDARLGKGTFALPSWKGEVWFKDIKVKAL